MSLLSINIDYKNKNKNVNVIISSLTDREIEVFLKLVEKRLKELKDETN